MNQTTSFIEITRERTLANRFRGYSIVLDGRKMDKIKCGETKRYAVPAGDHEVQIALDFYRSKPLTLNLPPGETVALNCGDTGPKTLGEGLSMRGIGQSLSSVLSPSDYLYVKLSGRRRATGSAEVNTLHARPAPEQSAHSGTRDRTSGQKRKIFLSYRRDDTRLVTGRIRDALAYRFGADAIFRDVDSIPLGTRFRDKIGETIAAADIVLAIIGPGWIDARDEEGGRRLDNTDDYVRFEIESALKLGLPLCPVLVEQAKMPAVNRLPGSLSGLADINAVIIPQEPYFQAGVERLIGAIGALAPGASAAPSEHLSHFCTGCGKMLNSNQRFCTNCGKTV